MEWIPVTELLPDPSTDVLCFVRFGSSIRQTVAGYFPVSQKDDGPCEWLEFAEPEKGLHVTHWMPLPPLPFNAGAEPREASASGNLLCNNEGTYE